MIVRFFLTLFLTVSLLSEPIPLQGEWWVVGGRVEVNQKFPTQNAIRVDSFPIHSRLLDPLPEGKRISISLHKKLWISESYLSNVREDLSLFIIFICNFNEVYLNGSLLFQNGILQDGNVVRNGTMRNQVVLIPDGLLKIGKNDLHIILSGDRREEIALYGGEAFAIDTVRNNLAKRSERIDLMLLFLYAFVGLYHLLLFAKRPVEKYNLFFGVFGCFLAVYLFSRTNTAFDLNLDHLILIRFEYPALFMCGAFYFLFLEEFLLHRNSKFSKGIFLLFCTCSFLMLLVSKVYAAWILKICQVVMIPVLVYSIFLMFQAVLNKKEDSKRIVFGFLVLVATIFSDLIGALRIFPIWSNLGLTKYGFFFFYHRDSFRVSK